MKIDSIHDIPPEHIEADGFNFDSILASVKVVLWRHKLDYEVEQNPIRPATTEFEGGMKAIIEAGYEYELPVKTREVFEIIKKDKAARDAGEEILPSDPGVHNLYTAMGCMQRQGYVPFEFDF